MIGRVFRYLGWVVFLPVTLIGLAWRRLVRRGRRADPTPARTPSPATARWLQRRPWLTACRSRCSSCSSSRCRRCRCGSGFSDDSGTPQGSPPRIAYDLTADGFGPGVNGPFYIAVQLAQAGDQAAVTTADRRAEQGPGRRRWPRPHPVAADATVVPLQVVPKTAPQDEATTDLLYHLREDVIPQATASTGAKVVRRRLPGGHRGLHPGADRRAAVVPADRRRPRASWPWWSCSGRSSCRRRARSSSLLSLGGRAGHHGRRVPVGLVLQHLIKLEATGPIFPFLPVMVFAILFGLSCDYQVFLVSRMHEEWVNTDGQPQGGPARAGRLRPGGGDGRGDHDERVRRVHPRQRRHHQAVRRRAVDGRAVRRVRRPPRS